MAQLRLLLIISLAWFASLFNIERIGLLFHQSISLDTAVYAIMIITGVAFFCFPNIGKQSKWVSLIIIMMTYLVSRVLRGLPITATSTAVDGAVMFGGLLLLRRVSMALLEFELAVQAFVLDVKSARLVSRMEGEEQVNQELYRARRFERPVAVLYCTVQANSEEKDSHVVTEFFRWRITHALRQRYAQVKIAQAVASLTYKSDCIIEQGGDVVVCLPETDVEAAQNLARRITRFTKELSHLDPLIGIATFPTDG